MTDPLPSPFSEALRDAAADLLVRARAQGVKIAAAESCTGGLVLGLLTEIPGSSDVIERGFVTYSNAAKTQELGVPEALIAEHGAVSLAVAQAMAEGAVARSEADVAVSVTGVAGPDGGTAEKPVGLVCFGIVQRGAPGRAVERRFGDLGRSGVRLAAVATALELLREALNA